MSNEVVSWSERLAREAKEVIEAYRPDIGSITFDQGILKYEGVQVPDNKMDVVVLGAAFVNLFYKKEWVAGQLWSPPDCYAMSLDGRGMVPEASAKNVQNTDCMSCINLKWGSDPKGGRGKACKEKMRLIVIPAGNLSSAETVAKSGVGVFTLPVMSVEAWKLHAQRVSVGTGGSYWGVVSRMKEVPDKKAQYKIEWETQAKIEDPTILNALAARLDWACDHITQPYKEQEEAPAPTDTGKKKKF